jgi:hypothetical protein
MQQVVSREGGREEEQRRAHRRRQVGRLRGIDGGVRGEREDGLVHAAGHVQPVPLHQVALEGLQPNHAVLDHLRSAAAAPV